MKNRRIFFSHLQWIFSVSNRFSRVDRNGRSAVTTLLATLGISFGVMTLIVVMSVMNGFQMGFKDAIMEISSYHVRVSVTDDTAVPQFLEWCKKEKNIRSVTPFYEAESFIVSTRGRQSAAVIRAVPSDVFETDKGFARELTVTSGVFDIMQDNTIILGSGLAYTLGVNPGDSITLLALSGGSDVELLSRSRKFTVTGVFHSGYADINSSYAFINLESGRKNFGTAAKKIYGLKLNRVSGDGIIINGITGKFPQLKAESWRSYNRSFFGVLRIEKNILMMLVFLIFVVVGINIYNGMRRLVFERRSEISILSALGGRSGEIKSIFIMRGFLTGFTGALTGVILGLLISVNIGSVFRVAADIMYYVQYFMVLAFNPENATYVQENPMYLLYATIPARILPVEVFLIALFGILAPLGASFAASRNVLKMTVAEVLHDE
jgi:lipoprotein-releasing system permease protein